MYQHHSISSTKPSSRTVLAALAGFAEGARAVKSSCAHHYVLDGFTLPMWKTSGGTFQTTEPWTRIKQTPTYQWCVVETYKASTCAGECLITGRSPRPNHPQISGVWIAPTRWPTIVSAIQGNTSSRIQSRFSFVADAMQLCIKQIFVMLVHVACS